MVTSINTVTAVGNAAFAPVPKPVTSTIPNLVPINNRLGTTFPKNKQLTLANGMTAGYGDQDGHTDNPPAYQGTYGGNPKWPIKRIGVMRNANNSLPGNKKYSLYFIFNPNEITTSFTTNMTAIPAVYLYGPNTATFAGSGEGGTGGQSASLSTPNVMNSQTVSWSLIFDRTYDMLYGVGPNLGVQSRGVLEDVAALYNLMGTFASQGAVPMSTPVEVIFGQNDTSSAYGQLWGFTGYISSVNITYGIFKYNMIPSRCEVDISMTAVYVAPGVPGNGGNSSTTKPTKSNPIVVNGKVVSNAYAAPPPLTVSQALRNQPPIVHAGPSL